jgi:DivIVA domain-containing protein
MSDGIGSVEEPWVAMEVSHAHEGVQMETKTQNPSFTVSLRGYDREEVDEYLDSLAEALGHVEDAEEHNRRLQSHVNRLNTRIKELEDRINSESPRSGIVVGERIGILLREAEDTATDTVARAEAKAAEILAKAQAKAEEADETVKSAVARGEEQARRIESIARGEAADILAEAEGRAAARTRQIEQWAEQVISHTRSEEARMLREHQERKRAAAAELAALAEHRHQAASTLASLRDALAGALAMVDPVTEDGNLGGGEGEGGDRATAGTGSHESAGTGCRVVADIGPHASASAGSQVVERAEGWADAGDGDDSDDVAGEDAMRRSDGEDSPPGGETVSGADDSDDVAGESHVVELHYEPEDDQFEAKLEAWVAGGAPEGDTRE